MKKIIVKSMDNLLNSINVELSILSIAIVYQISLAVMLVNSL